MNNIVNKKRKRKKREVTLKNRKGRERTKIS
jgi:hypothetical protein